MVNAINDLINLFSEWVESPGFAQGAAFVLVMMLLGSLLDMPYVIYRVCSGSFRYVVTARSDYALAVHECKYLERLNSPDWS